MRALVWTAPESIVLEEVELPVAGPNDVLIEVDVVGICGSEIEGYLGHNSLRLPPLIMGHEVCGRIASPAPGFRTGQRVVVNPLLRCGTCEACRKGAPQLCPHRKIIGIHRPGAFADALAVPVSSVVLVPDELDAHRAALTEPLACSLRATRRALEYHQYPNVVIFGAGGIGLLCLMSALILGARHVTVVDTNSQRLQMASELGAAATLNSLSVDIVPATQQSVASGVDVVIDAAGFQPTREAAMRVLSPGGTFMNIGLGIDETTLPINHLIRSEIRVLGSFCYSDEDFHHALELLADGRITETSWTERRPLPTGGEAFADLVAGRVSSGKIFLEVSGK